MISQLSVRWHSASVNSKNLISSCLIGVYISFGLSFIVNIYVR